MNNYLQELNPVQLEAVTTIDGPLMIVAGAGSGKTRVLTYRVAYLISKGVDPFQILALTFTNKAAKEMKDRIERLVGHEAKNIWAGTFHSIFARILRVEAHHLGYPSNFTIYDAEDSRKAITQVLKDNGLNAEIYKPKSVQARISSFKNSLITKEAYWSNSDLISYDASSRMPKMGEIYAAYCERCFRAGVMDFDDLLVKTYELLNKFPEVLAKYQNRFRYMMVDEYQDTNHAQYLIIKMLASRYENICVVGDDSQSIYSFRGADIRNILSFKKDYPDAAILKLEQNYRSSKHIVAAANSIIKNNQNQIKKEVYTENAEGEKLNVYRADSDSGEASFVAENILERQLREQLRPSAFAILYRTNAQSRAIEEALRRRNIKYRIYGGVSFFQRKEVKDLLAYLKVTVNTKDEESLRRIINYPARGIGDTTVEKISALAHRENITLWEAMVFEIERGVAGLNSGTRTKLHNFVSMIQSFQYLTDQYEAFELAEHIAKSSGIVREYQDSMVPEDRSRLENINEVLNGIQTFVERSREEDIKPDLATYLSEVLLLTDADTENPDDKDSVSLMTIHLAKGLEFQHVYIVGLEENLFPSMMALDDRNDLEEERRLFYVAVTRAEKSATLCWAINRFRWGKIVSNEQSRFIQEIDSKSLNFLNPNTQRSDNSWASPRNFVFPKEAPKPSAPKAAPVISSIIQKKNLKRIPPASAMPQQTFGLEQYVPQARIEHETFGKGTITTVEGDGASAKATVMFDHVGEKKLLLKFAKIKLI
jgi:DNA helicase-2/ATP-dependent DNA helicase PcrA